MDYKKLIIEMLKDINDEKFLKQIYTIIIRHIRRTGEAVKNLVSLEKESF